MKPTTPVGHGTTGRHDDERLAKYQARMRVAVDRLKSARTREEYDEASLEIERAVESSKGIDWRL